MCDVFEVVSAKVWDLCVVGICCCRLAQVSAYQQSSPNLATQRAAAGPPGPPAALPLVLGLPTPKAIGPPAMKAPAPRSPAPPLAPIPKAVWFAFQAAKAKSQSRAARRGERPPSWLPKGGEEARVSQEDFGSRRQLHPASYREEEEDPHVFWIPHVGEVRGSIARSLRRRSLGDDAAHSASAHGRRKQRPHHRLVLVPIKPQRKRRTEPGDTHHPNIDLGDPDVPA